MKRFIKVITTIMLTVAVVCAAGCKKTDDPNDPNNGGNGDNGGGGNGSGTELPAGMYLGVIGFNDALHIKPITLLDGQSTREVEDFIEALQMSDATLLIEAVNTSLDNLSSSGIPKDLINVSIVNFTDGMDEGSWSYSNYHHGTNYNNGSEYLQKVTQRILNERIAEKDIEAHTIAIQGNDVHNADLFSSTLNGISSLPSTHYVHLVSDFSEVEADFKEIAENLHQTSTNSILTMRFPIPDNPPAQIRFTFDVTEDALLSQNYIEGIFIMENGKGVLKDVKYVGLSSSSGNRVTANTTEAVKVEFKFEGMKDSNNNNFTGNSIEHVKKWTKNEVNNTWIHNSEWVTSGNTYVDHEYYSSLIMLNLDCSLSLGNQAFRELKNCAKDFVETLVSSNNGGGGNIQSYNVSVSANPSNGGSVSGGGNYQYGQSCTLTATPASGYAFVNWTENDVQVSTDISYSFTVMGNRSLVANFDYDGGDPGEMILFTESFANGQGQFTIHDVGNIPEELSEIWYYNPPYSCMYASGYSDIYAQSYNTESWLVSPYIELSSSNSITLQFDQAVKYAPFPNDRLHVMISTNYNGNVTQATWTELNLDLWPSGNDWVFITSMANMSSFANRNIVIAFKYTSTTNVSPAWELRNIEVKAQ